MKLRDSTNKSSVWLTLSYWLYALGPIPFIQITLITFFNGGSYTSVSEGFGPFIAIGLAWLSKEHKFWARPFLQAAILQSVLFFLSQVLLLITVLCLS
ncbi:MAG TPA: hypothetical protein V6C96_00430, partial [Vampirovibrionales bacterium]